jgi:hypothetical protein
LAPAVAELGLPAAFAPAAALAGEPALGLFVSAPPPAKLPAAADAVAPLLPSVGPVVTPVGAGPPALASAGFWSLPQPQLRSVTMHNAEHLEVLNRFIGTGCIARRREFF